MPINWTIVELKCVFIPLFDLLGLPINWTIVELKSFNFSSSNEMTWSINWTIVELKYVILNWTCVVVILLIEL